MQNTRRVLTVLFFTLMLDMIGVGMLIPIIPIIFTDPTSHEFLLMDYSPQWQLAIVGLITAIFGLMQFVAAPILGELSDAYGRKKLLTLGVGLLAVSQMLFGFGIMAKSLVLLFIARAIAGLAGANFSVAQASIADISKPEDRAKNFGLIGAAFGIGFILGPVLGGLVANWAGSAAAPFWAAGALGVVNLISVTLFLRETRHGSGAHEFHILKGIHHIQAAIRDKDARPVYLANFLYMAGFSFFVTFIGVLLVRYGFDEASIGTFFGIVGAWIVVTQLFILRIVSKKFSEAQILKITILIVAAVIVAYPFMPGAIWLYVLLPIMAIPQGLSMANLGALVSKSVGPERQGAALGINGSLIALAQGAIPLVAGGLTGVLGLEASFIAGGIVMATAWLALFAQKSRAAWAQ
jgi:DHA1 family tetracycline resistance protein-like MFS transporter